MKIRNIIFVVCVVVALVLSLNTISYADKIDPNDFKPNDINNIDAGNAVKLGEKIVGGITAVGTVVAVVTTMGMGIKYMVGSIEERAEYKKSMMPMFIGMMLLFGVSWLIKLIFDIMSNISI